MVFEIQSPENRPGEKMVSKLEKNTSPKWDRISVRGNKRPLLDSRTRCKLYQILIIRPKSVKRSSSVTRSGFSDVLLMEDVIVYGQVRKCHVTFGRLKLHIV